MGSLAEIIISFLNLLEAEGRALRSGIAKAGLALAVSGLVGALLMAGMGLIVWALYLYLRLGLGPATAALIDGFITLIFAGFISWLIRMTTRR